jgi:hypothetical protein
LNVHAVTPAKSQAISEAENRERLINGKSDQLIKMGN